MNQNMNGQVPNMNGQVPIQPNMNVGQPVPPMMPVQSQMVPQPMQQPIPQAVIQPVMPQPMPGAMPQQMMQQPIPSVQPMPQIVSDMPTTAAVPPPVIPNVEPAQPIVLQNPAPPEPTAPSIPQPAQQVINNVSGAVQSGYQKILGLDRLLVNKYGGITCGVFMILGVFVPYATIRSSHMVASANIWNGSTMVGILFIILGLIPIGTFYFQKARRLAYISAGASLGFAITGYDFLVHGNGSIGLGLWLLMLSFIGIIALNISEDLPEIKSLFSFETRVTPLPQAPGLVTEATTPSKLPTVGVPASMAAAPPVIAMPTVSTVPVCANCGQPRKLDGDLFCQTCGQKY